MPKEKPESLEELFDRTICVCCGGNFSSIRYPIDKVYASLMSGIDIHALSIGVAVCDNCGHEAIQPVPRPAFVSAFYSNYMSKAKPGFYKERSAEVIPERFRSRYSPSIDFIAQLLGDRHRLLDVGAGLGMFLRLARERGFDVQGIEPNKEAADTLRERHNIPVLNGLFEEVDLAEKVDAVTMWDLLEHLADPRGALGKAASLLGPKGLLVLEIPARDSLLHTTAKALFRYSGGRIRRPLYLVCGVHHLHYFSEDDISRLLAETGFEVREIRRGETELESLYRGKDGRRSFSETLYNVALASLFGMARVMGRQNKLIIFAQKV